MTENTRLHDRILGALVRAGSSHAESGSREVYALLVRLGITATPDEVPSTDDPDEHRGGWCEWPVRSGFRQSDTCGRNGFRNSRWGMRPGIRRRGVGMTPTQTNPSHVASGGEVTPPTLSG